MLKVVSVVGLLFIILLLTYATSVLALAMTLSAVGEYVVELIRGSYTLDTIIVAALLTVGVLSHFRVKVEVKKSLAEAVGAAIGYLLASLLFFASVYALPLFGIHPPQHFMTIYSVLFPVWLFLNIVTIILVVVLAYIISKS